MVGTLPAMTVYTSDDKTTTGTAADDVVDVDAEPIAEPEGADADEPVELADVQDAEVVTDVAVPDPEKWVHPPGWKHDDWLEFHGDVLAIRVPSGAALTALYQAGQNCSPEFQLKLNNKFVQNHLSKESIERVLERMSDPDDEAFKGIGVWAELLGKIAEIGGERARKDAEALAEVTSGKGK